MRSAWERIYGATQNAAHRPMPGVAVEATAGEIRRVNAMQRNTILFEVFIGCFRNNAISELQAPLDKRFFILHL
jgi:hypothetical protein